MVVRQWISDGEKSKSSSYNIVIIKTWPSSLSDALSIMDIASNGDVLPQRKE